jgi:hypothetical protein
MTAADRAQDATPLSELTSQLALDFLLHIIVQALEIDTVCGAASGVTYVAWLSECVRAVDAVEGSSRNAWVGGGRRAWPRRHRCHDAAHDDSAG